MTATLNPAAARAALQWLVDMGADEALNDEPVNRFAVASLDLPVPPVLRTERQAPAMPVRTPVALPVTQAARELAERSRTLDELREAVMSFEACPLKRTAKHTVFADGPQDAPVMLIGEAPGRDEDLQGLPFVGRSGQLLDRMLNAIGLDRTRNAYITNVIYWRPPGNRPPTAEEAASCAPFLLRHIELKQPKVLVLLGGTPVKHVLNVEEGITKMRGRWGRYQLNGVEIPALPTFHPAYLLRQPGSKRQAWFDLMNLKLKLRELGVMSA